MTDEVLRLKNRCEAGEQTVPRAMRAAANLGLSSTEPAAATAPRTYRDFGQSSLDPTRRLVEDFATRLAAA